MSTKADDIPYIICVGADVRDVFSPTNVRGVCSRCHAFVQHRPHIPTPSHLICVACVPALQAEAAAQGDTITYGVTRQTLRDLQYFYRRN